ncbi:MAG TPA: 3-deoxy-manno-octulosonate cytidylyltransferase [Terriglobia bacterium]|nr:3-deoxy-manno-octulosonate cytidylyltransferase [Terriglobia bacterium]
MTTTKTLRIVGIIPARLHSERLPGKVLRRLAGRAMLHHVYERARGCPLLDELVVATDAESVRDYCAQHGIPACMTSAAHRSGTERIHETMQEIPADVYLNLQADEPLLTAAHVQLLAEPFLAGNGFQVTTLKVALEAASAANPNIVKVVTDRSGRALYFSRAPIPHRRDPGAPAVYYKHLGLYGYRRAALEQYVRLAPAPLEQAERLEQLRFLENGIPILVSETTQDTIGVDTEEDFQAVRRLLESASS